MPFSAWNWSTRDLSETLALVLFFFLTITTTESFSFPPQQRSYCNRQLLSTSKIHAKPPPSSIFDLDSIEAFESELDKLEQQYHEDDDDLADDDNEPDSNQASQRRYEIPPHFVGKRIDAVIAALEPELSRSFVASLLADGHVSLVESLKDDDDDDNNNNNNNNNAPRRQVIRRKSFKVEKAGQIICLNSVQRDSEAPTEILAQDLPLDILYEDEYMIAINKASNMVVHPAAGNWDGTVVNALAYYLTHKSPYGCGEFVANSFNNNNRPNTQQQHQQRDEQGEAVFFRPGIVHRLDKGTTGVLIVAKTSQVLATLSADFAARRVRKTYLAITVGNPGKRVVIDKPMERHPIHRQRMRVVPDHGRSSQYDDDDFLIPPQQLLQLQPQPQRGRRALSLVDTIAFDGKLAFVRVRIETGRTHQIRVHLQDRHTPIYGDDVYGLTDWNRRLSSTHQIERPLLHAYCLELNHPVTGKRMLLKAPLPEDMRRIAKTIYPQGEQELPTIFSEQTNQNSEP